MAIVKCMAGNFKEAFELCQKVDTATLATLDRIKHEIKKASVLKKGSCYREGLAVLTKVETDVTEEIMKDDDTLKLKFIKLLHKILRDKARLFYLLKDKLQEQEMEESACVVYTEYLAERGIRPKEETFWGFPILNIKVIKIVFNRAYRLSATKPEEASKLYSEILVKLDEMMPEKPDSYYHAKMNLEIAKAYASRLDKEQAMKHVEIAAKMLEKEYGTDHGIYLDFIFTKITMSFDIEFSN